MKGKELAIKLLENPDHDVILSIDISTCEDDAFLRAHADDIECVQVNENDNSVSIISVGMLNDDTDVEILQKQNKQLKEELQKCAIDICKFCKRLNPQRKDCTACSELKHLKELCK